MNIYFFYQNIYQVSSMCSYDIVWVEIQSNHLPQRQADALRATRQSRVLWTILSLFVVKITIFTYNLSTYIKGDQYDSSSILHDHYTPLDHQNIIDHSETYHPPVKKRIIDSRNPGKWPWKIILSGRQTLDFVQNNQHFLNGRTNFLVTIIEMLRFLNRT